MDVSGDGKISVQDMNPSLQPSPYTNYITLATVVRYIVPNNFKDSSTFIFMGKLTVESEEVTVLQNSGNYTTNSTVSHPKGPKSFLCHCESLKSPNFLSFQNSTITAFSIHWKLNAKYY
jgi:hypothetical protein